VGNLLRITENSDIVLCDDSLGATLPKRDYRVLVSRALPNAETLLRRFNRSLAEFIKSEEYRKILAKYGILDAGRQSAKEGL
jgi:ABC-type amino acid transport substrate-binding protein